MKKIIAISVLLAVAYSTFGCFDYEESTDGDTSSAAAIVDSDDTESDTGSDTGSYTDECTADTDCIDPPICAEGEGICDNGMCAYDEATEGAACPLASDLSGEENGVCYQGTCTECLPGDCDTLKNLGGTCSFDHVCASDFCVDGVCCESACDGLCATCGGDGLCDDVPADDADCGEIDCDVLDTSCRDFTDLTDNRCVEFGVCATSTTEYCTEYVDDPDTRVCRPSAGLCDREEYCDGNGSCPSDQLLSSANVCRASAGDCDVAESCTGSSAACPADGFMDSTTECRASVDLCDAPESCTGSSAACPADGFIDSTTECRASVDLCDAPESCTGSSAACPADGFLGSTTVCRGAAGGCDVAENCTGTLATCPADGVRASGYVCQAGNACTNNALCTGAKVCPARPNKPDGTDCPPLSNICWACDAGVCTYLGSWCI